jgi:hypothetical protein
VLCNQALCFCGISAQILKQKVLSRFSSSVKTPAPQLSDGEQTSTLPLLASSATPFSIHHVLAIQALAFPSYHSEPAVAQRMSRCRHARLLCLKRLAPLRKLCMKGESARTCGQLEKHQCVSSRAASAVSFATCVSLALCALFKQVVEHNVRVVSATRLLRCCDAK